MITLNFWMGGTKVETKLEDRLCLLRDESGKGKTYLFGLISAYAEQNGLPYAFFTNNEAGRMGVKTALNDYVEDGIVMIDDGFVYSKDLIDCINSAKCHVVCDIKSYGEFPVRYRRKFGRYVIDVESRYVRLRRIGGEDII